MSEPTLSLRRTSTGSEEDSAHNIGLRGRLTRPMSVHVFSLWLIIMASLLLPTVGLDSEENNRNLRRRATADGGQGGGAGFGHRPQWNPLEGGADVDARDGVLLEMFRSSEVLQMYHIQATGMLYEQGGLNHDMTFALTAVAFYSLERPEAKVSMAYHPTDMTISLLPVISEDGRELHWENQEASVSYVMDIDQAYWTATSYMGETTGAFFSYAVEFSLAYHEEHPRYQPFSVYEDYPGNAFVIASSCDEYVWELLSAAQERGVRLAPAVMPQKHKIVIYSQTEPEIITLEAQDDGDGDQNGHTADETRGTNSSNSTVDDDSSVGAEHETDVGYPSSLNGSTEGGESGNSRSSDGDEGVVIVGGGGGENGGTSSGNSGHGGTHGSGSSDNPGRVRALSSAEDNAAFRDGQGAFRAANAGFEPEVRTDSALCGEASVLLSDTREMKKGSRRELGDSAPMLRKTPECKSGVTSVRVLGDEARNGRRYESKELHVRMLRDSTGDSGAETAGENSSLATVFPTSMSTAFPTVAPTNVSTIEPTIAPTIIPTSAQMDDWQQVVAYYQSLQLCLQERKFSFVTSLKDFAQYFDCLDDVAFISKGPHEYYKVNLTSTKLDHITQPEELPELQKLEVGFTWVDIILVIWIVLILACGVHGMLWQGDVMQHWMKASKYAQDEENAVPDGSSLEHDPPSLTRKITSEYLRLGHVFLGKPSYEFIGHDAHATEKIPNSSSATPTALDSRHHGPILFGTSPAAKEGVADGKSEGSETRQRQQPFDSDLEEARWAGQQGKRNRTRPRTENGALDRTGEDEDEGIEMQRAWPTRDSRSVGAGGDRDGSARSTGMEGRGGSLMREASAPSSSDESEAQSFPSSPLKGKKGFGYGGSKQTVLGAHEARRRETALGMIKGVADGSGGDLVHSPQRYTSKSLGAGVSIDGSVGSGGEQNDASLVILPHDSWEGTRDTGDVGGDGNGREEQPVTRNGDKQMEEESKIEQLRSPRLTRDADHCSSDDAR